MAITTQSAATSDLERYQQLCQLSHQRMLEAEEIVQLRHLSQALQKPNPLQLTSAQIYTKVAVLNPAHQVLILWRSPQSPSPDRADLPGGGIDFGEHPDNAAKREAQEEAGLNLQQLKLVVIGNSVHNDKFQLMFGYQGVIDDQQVTLSWEHDRFAWLDIQQALSLDDLTPHNKTLLEAIEE